jgi:hypothetical protein
MDQTTLVERDIEEGRRLVQALDEEGFPVVAAFWYYIADEDVWRLIVASPIVADQGPRAAYSEIQRVIGTRGISLPLQQISVEAPDAPLVTELRIFAGTAGTSYVGGTYFHRTSVGDVFVEGAYVYRAERIVGQSGTIEMSVVFRDQQSKVWKAYRCMLTFKDGFFDEVKVEGHELHQSRSRSGLNVRLFILSRHETKGSQTFGDVQQWTVVGGRLRSVETIARGVPVEGLAVTKATA